MRIIVIVLLVVSLAVPLSVAAAPQPAESCQNVAGEVEALSMPIGPTTLQVTGTTITGDLGGAGASLAAIVEVVKALPGGTWHLTGVHTFTSGTFGTFMTSDQLVITPSGHFNNRLTITDGATGVLHSHGVVNLATGQISGRYHGRVCS